MGWVANTFYAYGLAMENSSGEGKDIFEKCIFSLYKNLFLTDSMMQSPILAPIFDKSISKLPCLLERGVY
jgi:hypothetical protein